MFSYRVRLNPETQTLNAKLTSNDETIIDESQVWNFEMISQQANNFTLEYTLEDEGDAAVPIRFEDELKVFSTFKNLSSYIYLDGDYYDSFDV